MSDVTITIGTFSLSARFEAEAAPRTCELFRTMLPLEGRLLHVRWSGQAVWLPMGDMSLQMPPENATSYPAVGEVVIYPGGISETEILIPYGAVRFASKAGQLAGNHFLTIVSGVEHLREIGRRALWEGAQPFVVALNQR
jgi:hypothetical protein